MAVPDSADAVGRWALDHLFIDQTGVPVLVETKRSSDTRARREVVAQMLDYAANAVVYWPLEAIQMQLQARCVAAGQDMDVQVSEFLEDRLTSAQFWEQVKTNLQAGRIRMMFVADQIGYELERIIEFLNQQMDPAEVVGLELRQYQSGELQTLVPRWIGHTASATARKAASPARTTAWTVEEIVEAAQSKQGQPVAELLREIIGWAEVNRLAIKCGTGALPSLKLVYGSSVAFDITVYNTGPRLYLSYITARGYGVLDPELNAITEMLAAVAGTRTAPVNNRSYPGLVLDARITQPENRQALLGLADSFLTLLKQAPQNI